MHEISIDHSLRNKVVKIVNCSVEISKPLRRLEKKNIEIYSAKYDVLCTVKNEINFFPNLSTFYNTRSKNLKYKPKR